MKPKILLLFISIAIGTYCHSQCGKKITVSATGAEILNELGEIKIKDTQRVTTIIYDSKVIEIISEMSTLYGTVDSIYCNWTIPFKEGNTTIMGTINYENGDQRTTKLIITGKEGKLTLLAEVEHPDANKMRFVLDKFEEIK